MPNRHAVGHRDQNEPEIIHVLDAYHVDYIKLREGDGADLLVLIQPVELWEVKNPSQPKSKRALTPLEAYRGTYCALRGIPYRVIETCEQATEILGDYFRANGDKP